MPGALMGVRVVDFGHYIAGPLAATMLSDQGADVIHVDPPGGPRWKSDADAFLNRGKRRIDVDHVGALVGQHRGGERPGDVVAEVDHAHARERPRHQRPPLSDGGKAPTPQPPPPRTGEGEQAGPVSPSPAHGGGGWGVGASPGAEE